MATKPCPTCKATGESLAWDEKKKKYVAVKCPSCKGRKRVQVNGANPVKKHNKK